jgi:putative transposase
LTEDDRPHSHERWAHLRFSVVGPLLASPPTPGELYLELSRLAEKEWRHPRTGAPIRFAVSTIERWYYAARAGMNPVNALYRKVRKDRGSTGAITEALSAALRQQYRDHPSWSYKLHLDNLTALAELQPGIGKLPSYPTLRRFMQAQGLLKQPRKRAAEMRDGERRVLQQPREVRSYESAYVGGLWHLDFHHGSLKVLTPQGGWVRPILLAILDDRSRLVAHAQWYLDETAESLIHGLVQAFLKRGLPRCLLSDNGPAMIAAESVQGLKRLSILQQTTLPYSPHQNGKQEVLWAQVEGRLLAMLEGQPDLSLALLNEATQAWLEMEYHHALHSETNESPLARFLAGPSVLRNCPSLDELYLAFTAVHTRMQRCSDGTLSIDGVRFEIPSRFRHLHKLRLRYASWDLTRVFLVDEKSEVELARLFPIDKARNADGVRRVLDPVSMQPVVAGSGIAPLLRKLMTEYAATGLPPAYIPKEDE